MFFPTIRWIIISFSIIFIIHNTYLFFLENMTVPKIQNVSEMQAACYNDIYNTIGNNNSNQNNNSNNNNQNNNSNSNQNNKAATDDLSAFLSDLKQRNTIANSAGTADTNNISLFNNNT